MLNIRKVKLELIADLDMYIFFEKELIGGASDIANRYTKANNTCLNLMIQSKNQNILHT